MNETIIKNLHSLLERISALPAVLDHLNKASIRYGLYAGSHISTLTGNRIPTDVDFLVHDDDLDLLKKTFPNSKVNEDESGELFLYPDNEDQIEFMGKATVEKDGQMFPFRLTDLAASKLTTYEVDGYKINLVSPEDSILLKAILRRGKDKGKFDIEDIQAVLEKYQIDRDYLRARALESGALSYTEEIWRRFGITL